MNIDRSFKIGVTSSVIATIVFIYLLDPALRFGTFLLTHVFGTLARGYFDRLFERAALLTGPDTGLQVLGLIVGSFTGLLLGGTVGVIAMIVSRARGAPAEAPPWITRWLSPVRACLIIILLTVFIILNCLMLFHSTMFQVHITSRFNQHLAAIAPYVPDRELKVLRSRWTQMTSERDYLAIYTDLNRIAAANSVRLPCGPDLPASVRSCR